MKKLFLLIVALVLLQQTYAQTIALTKIDTNNIGAIINSTPVLFTDFTYQTAGFNTPKSAPLKGTIAASSLWIGGTNNSNLYMAAETYRQNGGGDFQSGPVSNSYTAQETTSWEKVWKITKNQIAQFKQDFQSNAVDPSKHIAIYSWPGNGDVSKGQSAKVAPYVDANHDGIYNPDNGDYPAIKGDMCIYTVFNDDKLHLETGSIRMQAEVHRMVYAFVNRNSNIDNTIFVEYDIVNRSNTAYESFILGVWTDFDLGNYIDDYVGTDISRNMVYGYNGDTLDEAVLGYGSIPPAQAVILLNNDMRSTMYYNNDFSSVSGNPTASNDYYNYLRGVWKNGSPKTVGGIGMNGTTPTAYSFPGNPCGNTGWWEGDANTLNPPGDRRILASTDMYNLPPGASVNMRVAYVYARAISGDNIASVCALQSAADDVKTWYQNNMDEFTTGIAEQKELNEMNIYPNPSDDVIHINWKNTQLTNATVSITNSIGEVLKTTTTNKEIVVKKDDIGKGLFFVTITTNSGSITKKLIVE